MLFFSGIVSASENEGQWPMLNSDPAHTGVSKYSVSTYPPRILWEVDPLGSVVENNGFVQISSSRPVIGPDGNIVVVQYSGNISAVDPNGEIVWRSHIPGHPFHCTPAIGADGTIYLGVLNETNSAKGSSIYAFRNDGTYMWRFQLNDTWDSPLSICIDRDGILYCTAFFLNYSNSLENWMEGVVFALNPNGKMLWSSHIPSSPVSSPALANDGSIYVHARDGLFAYAKDGSQRWVVPLERNSYLACEVVTTQNSSAVLIHDGTLLSVSSDGNIEWQSERDFGSMNETWYETSLAYYDHTLIVVDNYGHGIYFYTENGTLKGYFSSMDLFGIAKAAVSNNGLIIVFNGPALIAFGIDGQEVWRIETDLHNVFSTGQDSPIIGKDGRIYLLIYEGMDSMNLMAFGENATILDGGPWSVYLLPLIVVLMAITVWLATRKKGKRT
jgi:outer membrane protein assembly factor BamB